MSWLMTVGVERLASPVLYVAWNVGKVSSSAWEGSWSTACATPMGEASWMQGYKNRSTVESGGLNFEFTVYYFKILEKDKS
jgi:hypothetical protein